MTGMVCTLRVPVDRPSWRLSDEASAVTAGTRGPPRPPHSSGGRHTGGAGTVTGET